MTRINTNVSSLRGIRNLGRANKMLNTSLTRLSTGLQVNSGKDNPSGLIAGETLRSQLTVIEQSIKNSNRANNVISTADSALGEISGLLNQVRGLVQEGLNSGALSGAEIEANQSQIDAALSAINRISANTSFAGDKLIDGSKAFQTTQTTADAAKISDFSINTAVFAGSATIDINATVTAAATKGQLFTSATVGGLAAATTVEVSGSKGTDVLFLGATSTLDDIATAVNGLTDGTGVAATKTAAVNGTYAYDSTAALSDLTFTDLRTTDVAKSDPLTIDVVVGAAATASVALAANGKDITISLGTTTTNNVANTIKGLLDGDAGIAAVLGTAVEGAGTGEVDDTIGAAANVDTAAADAYLTFESSAFGSDEFVGVNVLQGALAVTSDQAGVTAATRDAGTDIAARINGQVAQGKGLQATLNTAQLGVSLSFKAANNTVNETATIKVTGGGSLFQIGQDVSTAGQIGLGIDAVNTGRLGGASGKLFELGSGAGKSLLDVSPTTPGSKLVNIIEESISEVTSLRGRLGALQKNVIDTNIATLGVALESISEARSQVVDTDFASETAQMTKAQILSQSGLAVLGIANQAPSQVLSLLG